MQILFADAIADDGLEPLRSAGHTCVVDGSLTADTLPAAVAEADVLVVRSTTVTASTVAAAPRLGLIVRAGAGTDNIDKAAASARGIYVCNVPGKNAIAVAELTMGLLLAVDRQIPDNVADLRAGRWDKARFTKADGLAGKTMGIIGVGDIGLAVAERARAFGLSVIAERKDGRPAETQARIRSTGIRLVDNVDELLANADIVSLHVPKAAGTVGMVNATFLSRLQPGAILLNTSRGDVVDHEALLHALDSTDLRVGLDVYSGEPGSSTGVFDDPIARHPRVVGTHHIGASTRQAQEAVAAGTVEVIQQYLRGDVVNCVNLDDHAEDDLTVSIRHLDQVGVLAQILAVIRAEGLNVQQMSNQVFSHDGAAVATISLAAGAPDLDDKRFESARLLAALESIDEVLAATATPTS